MKVVVTGGAGFIGSNFVRHLLNFYSKKPTKDNKEIEIRNVDNLSYGSNIENLKEVEKYGNHRFSRVDITDSDRIRDIVSDADLVVNFAAETHVDRSISDPYSFFKNNAYGTFVLLETIRKSKGHNRFIQVSTDEVYGSAQESTSFSERDVLNPSSPYSATKAAADMLVRAYHVTYGIDAAITRCTNNFGPYQFPEKLIPKTVIRSILNLSVPVYGSGNQIRDWLYVLDHCDAIRLVMEKGRAGEIYNISAGAEISNIETVKMILDALGKQRELITHVEDRPGHDLRYSLDSSKIKSELGWKPKYEFKEALEETVKWYVKNEWWWKPLATDKIIHPTPWKLGW
nr:dTDP-glucose 4,6-dehydratase [Candidatus Njordarchaeum guaymaensis]